MASTEEVTKDILVAWLSNPTVMQGAGAQLAGKNAAQVGEFIAIVYRAIFHAVEETTREATEHGRAARRPD